MIVSTSESDGVMKYLRNKFIDLNTKINFVKNNNYLNVNTYNDVKILRDVVKNDLDLNRGIIVNMATGICAKITKETVNKIIFPKYKFNYFNKRYVDNLNAARLLKELFCTAIYIDTLKPMKNKSNSINEKGYHHFVAPLKMNSNCYKAYITVKQKRNSNILYVVSVVLFKFDYSLDFITAKDLIDNTSIWNYELNDYNYYSYADFIAEDFKYNYVWLIS